jgi:hypothetical protein
MTTPTEAFAKLRELEAEFGWAISVVTRTDVNVTLDTVLTDDQWDNLTDTKLWRKVLPEAMFAEGVELIAEFHDEIVTEET